jgi:2-polyprenyl-3-methyl-5-hydroxy-6-metoxy-1,4-benzoquinol methylase
MEIVQPAMEAVDRCDLCGGSQQTLLFVKEGFRHVRCPDCGLVFVNPRLAEHLEQQMVSGTGAMGDESLTSAQKSRLQKQLAELETFRKLNRLLEIGPGRGWFLGEATEHGWQTWAVEVNADALRHLQANADHTVLVDAAETFEMPEDAMVDVVRIWDVIEHLRSPRAAMGRAYRSLRPGGLLSLTTTNFASLSRWVNGPEWVYLNGADHIVLFEPRTITRLLEEVGFERVTVRTKSFNLRRKLYHPEQDLPRKASLLVPFRKIIDETIRVTPYGHQMIVTATKPDAIVKP